MDRGVGCHPLLRQADIEMVHQRPSHLPDEGAETLTERQLRISRGDDPVTPESRRDLGQQRLVLYAKGCEIALRFEEVRQDQVAILGEAGTGRLLYRHILISGTPHTRFISSVENIVVGQSFYDVPK